jgi:hypothetical protein
MENHALNEQDLRSLIADLESQASVYRESASSNILEVPAGVVLNRLGLFGLLRPVCRALADEHILNWVGLELFERSIQNDRYNTIFRYRVSAA